MTENQKWEWLLNLFSRTRVKVESLSSRNVENLLVPRIIIFPEILQDITPAPVRQAAPNALLAILARQLHKANVVPEVTAVQDLPLVQLVQLVINVIVQQHPARHSALLEHTVQRGLQVVLTVMRVTNAQMMECQHRTLVRLESTHLQQEQMRV